MSDISEKDFNELKRLVEDAKEDASRAKGAREQLMKRLDEEFDCKDLDDARDLLKRIAKQRDDAKKSFDDKMADYKKKWKK
jgi:hypothetical protein